MSKSFIKNILLYSIAFAALFFLLKWLEFKYMLYHLDIEVYIGAIALLFTGLGIWLANALIKKKEVIVEKKVYVTEKVIDNDAIEKLKISKREMEVLQLMSQGYSNIEIGEKLFLSVPTIKTHISNIFIKLDVKRRTQAIEKAQNLNII